MRSDDLEGTGLCEKVCPCITQGLSPCAEPRKLRLTNVNAASVDCAYKTSMVVLVAVSEHTPDTNLVTGAPLTC